MSDRICTHLHHEPEVPDSAWIAPGAILVGDVRIGERSSVWYHCALRADIESIRIGAETNIQDGTIIHLASDRGTVVGDRVTVGHRALLHACEVEDEVLVGMGATVMDGAVIGSRSIVAAGALVTKGARIPPGSLVVGTPARVVRSLTAEEQDALPGWAAKYVRVAAEHREAASRKNPG